MYFNGKGVRQNYSVAAKWFTQAANQGDADAQYKLGWMYDYGRGVDQNNIIAYMWWNIAIINGNKTATENRELIAKRMTRSAIEKAGKLTIVCMESKYVLCN